jgi:uncharacterized protein YuzE
VSRPSSDWRDPVDTATPLELTFGRSERSYPVECVLDLDSEGFVVGIEILGLVSETGVKAVPEADGVGVLSVSLDSEADALYIRLRDGTSIRQVVRSAIVSLASDDCLAGVQVQSSSPR